MRHDRLSAIVRVWILLTALLWGCAGLPPRRSVEPVTELIGVVTREEVESAQPDWIEAEMAARPDLDAATRLVMVAPGAAVDVYLGTWCSDSRRELSRLWRAFDDAGLEMPFKVRYVAVDRSKTQPTELVAGKDILFVPTIIVSRQGLEVGRIVETAPDGVELDLLSLLSGTASGILSARGDLGAEATREP